MERVNFYSEVFKKAVVQEVLSGGLCKDEARRKYGIRGNSAILNWMRKFDDSSTYPMKKKGRTPGRDITELEAENKRLKEELEHERLRSLSLNVMIDLAEEQFKIPIRKKSGAKQLKR
jgi:transposase-like protein